MSDVDEIARKIVFDTLPVDANLQTRERVGMAIAAALAAERAKWKAFADEKGEPLKTTRPLIHTKDGVIVQDGDWVSWRWGRFQVSNGRIPVSRPTFSEGVQDGYEDVPASECYSTSDAERAAKNEQEGKARQ
ncbi:MAG: hypothetical protein JSS51_07715 [Planctomycetes bacterium]|nr:hypothetical protein [Planctomycetota bacterium]